MYQTFNKSHEAHHLCSLEPSFAHENCLNICRQWFRVTLLANPYFGWGTVPQSQGDPKIVKRGPKGDPIFGKKGTQRGPFFDVKGDLKFEFFRIVHKERIC